MLFSAFPTAIILKESRHFSDADVIVVVSKNLYLYTCARAPAKDQSFHEATSELKQSL